MVGEPHVYLAKLIFTWKKRCSDLTALLVQAGSDLRTHLVRQAGGKV